MRSARLCPFHPNDQCKRQLSLIGNTLLAVVVVFALANCGNISQTFARGSTVTLRHSSSQGVKKDTVVLYVFSESDPEYHQNFMYFLDYGLGGENIDYIFILQETADSDFSEMPQLPNNAKYIVHNNECFDWGTFGWIIRTGRIQTKKYRHFVFLNSSVRGPFMPAYHTIIGLDVSAEYTPGAGPIKLHFIIQGHTHWTNIYTQRLNNIVKLVGSTINCQPVYWRSDPANEMRHNPHVQSYVVATDQAGLKIMLDEGSIFNCYSDLLDTVWYSEVGASRAILEAGYSIDSLMLKYAGVDWRDKSNWQCNGWQNPYADFAYDGLMINPLEVLFVKVKSYQLESDWITSKMARTYEKWHRGKGANSSANDNEFDKSRFAYFLSKAITMSMRGSRCFDQEYYHIKNPDINQKDATWQHFVNQGQFEGRPFRFTCENQYSYPQPDILKEAVRIARRSINTALRLPKE